MRSQRVALLFYLIRSLRAIGRKISGLQRSIKENKSDIQRAQSGLLLLQSALNLNVLPALKEKDWNYTLAFTSHAKRFNTLARFIEQLDGQILKPAKTILTLARDDLAKLDMSTREMIARCGVQILEVEDLGPGKKLIPLLKNQCEPIIVVDDDLILPLDLTLQLMVQHFSYPKAIIASRAHQVLRDDSGNIQEFSNWPKNVVEINGPSAQLLPTSGAGTLFPNGALSEKALDESRYKDLAFHTDDLWWYFHARAKGTLIRRIPGERKLEFIENTQEEGLWNTGNKARNDTNLKKLISYYGNPQ